MGDVFIRCDAETARAVQNLLKVAGAEEKIGENAKKAKQSTGELDKAFNELSRKATDFQGLLAQFVRIDPFTALQAGLSVLKAEFDATTGKAREFREELLKVASGSGDFFQREKLAQGLKNFRAPVTGLAERTAAFDAVSDATGGTLDERLALAEQASRAKAFRADPREFGDQLGEMKNIFKDLSLDDLADLTEFTRQNVDKFKGKLDKGGFKFLNEFVASGGDKDEGLSLLLSSFQARQGTEGASAILEALTAKKEFQPLKMGQGLSAEEKAERQFYGMSFSERLAALRADPSLREQVLGSRAGTAKAIFDQDATAFRTGAEEAQRGNLFERQIASGMQDDVNKKEAERIKREIAGERAGEFLSPLDVAIEKERTQVTEYGGGNEYLGYAVTNNPFVQMYESIRKLSKAFDDHRASLEQAKPGTSTEH
ncbi:MAG: hypothetical protein KIS92_04510 [Planctomycetota bacterium]|nr:hypothetical protein [Planctomycetota bacterium]